MSLPSNPWVMFLLGILFAQFVLPMLIGFVTSARAGKSTGSTANGK